MSVLLRLWRALRTLRETFDLHALVHAKIAKAAKSENPGKSVGQLISGVEDALSQGGFSRIWIWQAAEKGFAQRWASRLGVISVASVPLW